MSVVSVLCPIMRTPIAFVLSERPFGYTGTMKTELRNDPMMARLMDSLDAGVDIGHYGRLVFSMIARHFMTETELIGDLQKDRDFSSDQARTLLDEVKAADYSPPRRDKILEYQRQQDFPIIENTGDPDAGNVYQTLKFPDHVYEHIAEYREQRMHTRTT